MRPGVAGLLENLYEEKIPPIMQCSRTIGCGILVDSKTTKRNKLCKINVPEYLYSLLSRRTMVSAMMFPRRPMTSKRRNQELNLTHTPTC
jgi:hypothetical protein